MKITFPGLKTITMFGAMAAMACALTYTVNADSTITIPLPEDMSAREFTMSLRIPPDTQPLTREQQAVPKVVSKRSTIHWDSNPLAYLDKDDELLSILKIFREKGWIKRRISREHLVSSKVSKTHGVVVLQEVCNEVIQVAMAPNFGQVIKKVNFTPTDIEDLRRMIKRFETELVRFGYNPVKVDKDLLMIQEYMKKTTRKGMLKVLRVEGQDDGSTVIHLSVD